MSPAVGEMGITERTDLLVRSKSRFMAFLQGRVHTRDDAEDLLQAAYLRAVAGVNRLRDDEKVVRWFYQVLRNLLIDYYRKRATVTRLDEQLSRGADTEPAKDEELLREVCRCVKDLAEALKPEYREVLLRVELQDEPLLKVANDLGITANNASVRLHRGRRALREALRDACGVCAEHMCLDCTCRGKDRGRRPV